MVVYMDRFGAACCVELSNTSVALALLGSIVATSKSAKIRMGS